MHQTMTTTSESRPVSGFERVSLRAQHENELIITQGESESLTIEAPPDYLPRIKTGVRDGQLSIVLDGSLSEKLADALSTSLSRVHIRYLLSVRELRSLELYAIARVDAPQLRADDFSLRIKGIVEVSIGRLTAERLSVDFNGPGRVQIAGQVVEQDVEVFGPGQYLAPELASCRARLLLHGMGQARVWVEDSLEADVRGPGGVTYSGRPTVRQRTSPIGYVTRVGSS